MIKILKLLTICAVVSVLSACQSVTSYPRAHGENWKIYPYVPGHAEKVAAQGEACWAEENRANWDQCY